jgi:hypothetical protein
LPGNSQELIVLRARKRSSLNESLRGEVSEVLRGADGVAFVLDFYEVGGFNSAELGDFNERSDLGIAKVVLPVSILARAAVCALARPRVFGTIL